MDDETRDEIAESLETLAAQSAWSAAVWQRCFDLAEANAEDELIAYFYDDLIHYTGRSLFRREPRPQDVQSYSRRSSETWPGGPVADDIKRLQETLSLVKLPSLLMQA